ncbi:ATP-dependent zinc protease [Halomonas daqingensis]|uniref:ATP-dependent zinc protease n=1 Tax=Billgrantia desiderata TaxID=52021 RepID=A0ABS9B0C6_9GAMM|nr:ATP-dependent zinc protease [Halomonas desiderata]MCE8027238.1 ATP-dependent zinc protease [Halomonas desiderata]MCE8040905.1 ATP-dependent zinc protease [Halomonas desiderata]MCE8045480.1 ATP-dependent zinc protease [Halomonas desiderata]
MQPRTLSATVVWLLSSLLISGCALNTGPQAEPEPTLSPDLFETRIGQLEEHMALRCERAEAHFAQHERRQAELLSELRDAGITLRHLRGDIERLEQRSGDEPVLVPAECNNELSEALSSKEMVGRAEWIGLPEVGTYLRARVDSGANTSSLSATDVTRFERDGEDWVRFKLGLNENDIVVEHVRDEWIERPVERRVRILQAAGSESRPVVSLMMTLGPIRETVEFTLSDRTHLNYPVLLGRRFLMDIALIDVAENYLHPRPEFPGGRPASEAVEDQINDRDEEEG